MEQNGIQHDRITPLWPQANSQAESFMKLITKAIKSAYCEQKNWKEIYHFLLNYWSTMHCSTGYSPAESLFNRKINNKLPQQAPVLLSVLVQKGVMWIDVGYQQKQINLKTKHCSVFFSPLLFWATVPRISFPKKISASICVLKWSCFRIGEC